jgi:hypothetical protein
MVGLPYLVSQCAKFARSWVDVGSFQEDGSEIFRTYAVKIINPAIKRVWKLPTCIPQLCATWHTDSPDMVVLVLPSTGASRYHNCYIDGDASPEYFGLLINVAGERHGRGTRGARSLLGSDTGAVWHVWINAVGQGRGTTWARHSICELAFMDLTGCPLDVLPEEKQCHLTITLYLLRMFYYDFGALVGGRSWRSKWF